MEVDNDEGLSEEKNSLFNPTSLLELSAKIVAKHCSCHVLEQHEPPLDESLLRKVGLILELQSFHQCHLILLIFNVCLFICSLLIAI